MANLCVGKAVMMFSNAVFLVSGLGAVVLGALMLSDSPRVLMSRLILAPGTGSGASSAIMPPQPLLYYASLAAMGLGLVVCAVAVLGCWASCLHSYCILGSYLFLLALLLLGELSLGALAVLGPQFLGLAVEPPRLVDALQRGYGVPGREQFTAAFDLAQVSLNCCGVAGGSDYHASWWRLRELGQRDLLVPLSCCHLENAQDSDSFLDPKPSNLTLCQALQQDVVLPNRHMEGCGLKIQAWLSEQLQVLGAAGALLVLVQLGALLSAILVCVQLPQCRQKQKQLQLEQQLQEQRMSPRNENGFGEQPLDKYLASRDMLGDSENNNSILRRCSPPNDTRVRAGLTLTSTQDNTKYLMKDIVDSTVYHLPLPKEITPVVAAPASIYSGPAVPPAYQGKYHPDEVLYHHTDKGTVKYTLPQQRRPNSKPPKPPPKPAHVQYDVCNCDFQKIYQQYYGDTVAAISEQSMAPVGPVGRYQLHPANCLEPSPYQYVEELRASPYQQAMVTGNLAPLAANKRNTRQRPQHSETRRTTSPPAEKSAQQHQMLQQQHQIQQHQSQQQQKPHQEQKELQQQPDEARQTQTASTGMPTKEKNRRQLDQQQQQQQQQQALDEELA